MNETRFSTSWRLLLAPAAGLRVLEVSADAGERARALEEAGAEVTCLRESPGEAEALRGRGLDAVALDPGLSDDAFDAAALAVSLGRSHEREWTTTDLAALVRAVAAAMKPGARLALALPNPVATAPLVGGLVGRLLGRQDRSRPAAGTLRLRPVSARHLRDTLTSSGLHGVRHFAPFPDAHRPKYLVPLDAPHAAAHFFREILPAGTSPSRRLAARAAATAARLGLLDRLTPSHELVAEKRAR